MNNTIIQLLNKCKIPFEKEGQLEGMLIPREILLSMDTYNSIKEDIKLITRKKKFKAHLP